MDTKPTERLRELARACEITYTCGYKVSGRRIQEDTVTALYAIDGDVTSSITIEQDEDGALWVMDAVTPVQAVGLALQSRISRDLCLNE